MTHFFNFFNFGTKRKIVAEKKLMFSENLLKHWPNFWYCKIKPNKLPFFIDGINMNSFGYISGTFFYFGARGKT